MGAGTSYGRVVVVGGGPAGAMTAAVLAARGVKVEVCDEKMAWEKPCGGGLTDKALARYPFLRGVAGGDCAGNAVRECELTSAAGRRLLLALDREVIMYSRCALNGLLLERARDAGAMLRRERVTGVQGDGRGGWRVQLRSGDDLAANAVVLAAGARQGWREQFPTSLGPQDWMATAGYYIPLERLPWARQRMAIRFLPGLAGYMWSFPRGDAASVGICGPLGQPATAELRRRLEQVLDALGVGWQGSPFYAHLLPAPRVKALRLAKYEGTSPAPWALVGDAAGLVDPITGEGLYYALRSAELLGEAWSGGPAYTAALRQELVPELAAAAAIAPRFYGGTFLGAPVIERMAQFTARSPRFRGLMCDLFSGAQGYLDLRSRLYRQLLPSLWELAVAR